MLDNMDSGSNGPSETNKHDSSDVSDHGETSSHGETSQPSPSLAISDLPDIATIDSVLFVECFMLNMNYIFQFAMKDIQGTIEKRTFTELSDLRDKIFEKFLETFPNHPRKFLVNRKVIHTISNDIVNLGYSIVNENLTREVEKVTCAEKPSVSSNGKPIQPDQEDLQDMARLIILVCNLRQEVTQLKDTVITLQNELKSSKKSSGDPKDGSSVASHNGDDGHNAMASSSANSSSSNQSAVQTAPSSAPDVIVISDDDTKMIVNNLVSHKSPSSSSDTDSDQESLPVMTLVESRRKKKQRKKKSSPQKIIKPAAVSIKNSGSKSIDRDGEKRDVYLGNVDPSITADDVASHLQSRELQVKKENIRILAKGPEYHSFCIAVSKE